MSNQVQKLRPNTSLKVTYTTNEDFNKYSWETRRLLYRLKATALHNMPLFATAMQAGYILTCINISLAYSLPITATVLGAALASQHFSGYGFEDKNYYLDTNDLSKGAELVWSNGIKKTISLIYNAQSYECPWSYRQSYTPDKTENSRDGISI